MTDQQLIDALQSLSVETGSLACLGCGHEHNCSLQGAISCGRPSPPSGSRKNGGGFR